MMTTKSCSIEDDGPAISRPGSSDRQLSFERLSVIRRVARRQGNAIGASQAASPVDAGRGSSVTWSCRGRLPRSWRARGASFARRTRETGMKTVVAITLLSGLALGAFAVLAL